MFVIDDFESSSKCFSEVLFRYSDFFVRKHFLLVVVLSIIDRRKY